MKKSIFLFFAAILCAMSVNAKTIYLNAGGSSLWDQAGAVFTAKVSTTEYPMTKVFGSYYEGTVPDDATKVTFMRNNPAGGNWNKTSQLSIPTDGKNCYNITQWSSGNWSTYPPTFYIAGDFVTPTWDPAAAANKMDYADGVYSKSYNDVAASAHQFKITNGTWTNAIGYDKNTCSGTNCTVENKDGNIQFTPLAEGTVTITYTPTDGKIHITCPEPPAAEFNITYPATQTNYTLVAGPAKAQTGAEVSFTATPADGYVLNVTYNGNAITGNNNVYAFMMPAADVTIAIEAVVATTIYYVDNNSWGNANAYMWNDSGNNGWPGVTMTAAGTVGEHNYAYYSVSFAQGAYTSVIFSNNGSNQTADQTIETAKPYFYDGAWYTWDELLAKLAAPVVTYDYYIAGPLAGGWSATQMGMEKVAEGQYTCEFTKDAGDYQFKVTNGKWSNETGGFDCADVEGSYEEVSHVDGNVNVKLTSTTTFTVKFDSNTKKISFEGLTVAAPAPTFDYYIVGSFNGNDPKKAENGMTLDGAVYKATVTLAAGDNTLKVTKGSWDPTWGYTELGAAYEEVSNPNDGYNNIKITLAAEKEITVIFDATAGKITFEGLTEKTPVEDYYTIVGATAITGVNWDPANEANKMTKDGEVYTLTKTGLQLEVGDYEYKVAKNGAWGDGEYPNGSNQKVTIAENGVYTIVYTYTVGTSLTAVPTKTGEYTPDKPIYTVAGDAALCGTNWKADDTDNDMSDNGDGTFTWTKTGVKLTGDAGFKVVKNHDFGNDAYPAENWVIKIADYDGAAIYTVTITFTESSKEIAVTLTKTGDVTPPVISYVLMGVNNDWTTGIPMTVNPDNENEYVLTDQVIIKATDAVKVVTLTDGTATAWCGNVDTWSNATYTADGDGNIVLEDGIYTFYFKKNDNLIYINQTGYARDVTNKYGTICLPYASASTTGATFFEVVGQEAGKVYLASVTELEAGVPYIFEKSANQIKVVYTGEKETTAGSANGLVGTFADNTPVPNDAYILYGGAFCTNNDPTKPNKINAYRAYLDLSDVDGGIPQPMPGRKYIGMDVQGENEATGVEDLFSTDAPVKAIVNGQLIIIRDGVKYNVQGQKL